MQAAQPHPGTRDLAVRGGRFSAYIVELSRKWQKDMFARPVIDLG